MALRFHRAVLLGKQEVTYGTDPTPTVSADEIRCLESGALDMIPSGTEVDRNWFDNVLSNKSRAISQPLQTLTFRTMYATNGDAAAGGSTYWELDVLFASAGFVNTATAESVADANDGYHTILPSSVPANLKSMTFYLYRDGVKQIMTGAVCESFSIHYPAGDYPYIDWTFKGLWNAMTDAALPTPVYSTALSQMIDAATYTYNSVSVVTTELVINCNHSVPMDPSLSAAKGIKDFLIMKRDINGSFDMEAELVATVDPHGDWIANTERALALTFGAGGDDDDKWTISLPKIQLGSPTQSNRDGKWIWDCPFRANQNSGDDEFSQIMGAP